MASYTSFLNLEKPTTSERLDVLKINSNWDKIDAGVSALNSQITNMPDVSYASISGDSLSAFEDSLNSAINGMGTGDVRVCPAIANYSQSLTAGGQAVAFLSKPSTTIWWCFLVYTAGIKAGYKTGSTWTWL